MRTSAKIVLIALTLITVSVGIAASFYILLALRFLLNSYEVNLDITKGSALVVAICALVVAYNNFRRGNTAIIKLVELKTTSSSSAHIQN